LERIQHRFTRMVPGLKQLPYDQRLEALNLWTLEERRVRADLIEVYKIINGLSAVPFESFFQLDANTRTRGHSVKLKKKSFHTELRQHFFSERVINLWNSLDEETVTASSLNSFKNNLIRQRKHMKIGHVLGKWYVSGPTRPSQLPLVKPHSVSYRGVYASSHYSARGKSMVCVYA